MAITTDTGRHADLSFADYLAAPATSRSQLVDILRSPLHFYDAHRAPDAAPSEPTPAMIQGQVFHLATLQPEEFGRRYAQGPDCKRGTKAWDAAVEDAGGRELLKPDEWETITRARDAVWKHPVCMRLIAEGLIEHSYFWRREGLAFKCRPDIVTPAYVVDLKLTGDARHEHYHRIAWDKLYHFQGAMYLDGVETVNAELGLAPPTAFLHIVVERARPFAIAVYALDEGLLGLGRQSYLRALDLLLTCERSGQWPGYSPQVETLSPPAWAGF